MKDTLENIQSTENQNNSGDTTTPWDTLRGNNDNPFDLGDSAPARPFTEEELAKDNPFDLGDPAPTGPFTEEELAEDNPFNIDSPSASEAPESGNPFEV